MSPQLAANIRNESAQLQAMLAALGSVESIYFRGVGPGGYDFYGVKFSNGSAEFRIVVGADGKIDDLIFRPHGNGEPGGVFACSDEPRLKAPQAGKAPIKIFLLNESGADIQLYSLDSEGKRAAQRTIGDNRSSWILTSIDSPWVVADRSGQCLEILLPGQRTRSHTISGTHVADTALRRTTPLAGSEDALRAYIEFVGTGQPDYSRMSPEVADETRRQLPVNQAILARFGELRAISFRGVTLFGGDAYIAHFAHGSVEWRIGLARDGTITRIALGPP